MDRIKKQLRVNTLSLNYQNIYSILIDSYFNQLDDKSIISIPFISLLYRTYPALMIRLVTENFSIFYGYIIRFKHPLFYEAVRQSPQLYVDCIRIHLERIDVVNVFDIKLGDESLNRFINEETYDSLLTQVVDLARYEISPIPPIDVGVDADILLNFVTEVIDTRVLTFIKKAKEEEELTVDEFNYLFLSQSPIGGVLDVWGENRRRIPNAPICPLVAAAVAAARPIPYLEASKKIVSLINQGRLNRVLLHNLVLTSQLQTPGFLYTAFTLYPLSLTLVEYNEKNRVVFDEAVDLDFFRGLNAAIEFYKMVLDPNLIITGAINPRTLIPINIARFKSYDYLKFSLLDDEKYIKIVDVPDLDVKQHNAAQLANKILGNSSQDYLASDRTPTLIPVIDNMVFLQAVGDKKPLIPSNMVLNNLDESIEYYKALLPQSSMTAILLLLLYNSTNYMNWIEVFKKHREIMRHIITRSSLLLEDDKQFILERLENV